MNKRIILLLISFCFFTNATYSNELNKKIKVLIVDGQSTHEVWPKATIMMKQYLE